MTFVERIKSSKPLGWFVVFAGLLLMLAPIILPVCESLMELVNGKKVPMQCHWTVRGELIIGIVIVINGLLLAFARQAETQRVLIVATVVMGVLAILTPLYILPTCMNPDMACNLGTKPAFILIGGFCILLGLVGLRPKDTPSIVD